MRKLKVEISSDADDMVRLKIEIPHAVMNKIKDDVTGGKLNFDTLALKSEDVLKQYLIKNCGTIFRRNNFGVRK